MIRTPDVAAVRCGSYQPQEIGPAMERLLSLLGGLDWVRPGMRIAVKTNLVAPKRPETAATTHPEALYALVRLLRERGAETVLGDSPGGPFHAAYLSAVYRMAGLEDAPAHGAQLNRNFDQCTVHAPQAETARQFQYCAWLQQADAVIDFCKLKTHAMTGMTAAVKNLFGVVPGTLKSEYHLRYRGTEPFCSMLVDLAEYVRPRLCICDAVVGMEGNGPTSGRPRAFGVLAASASPHALDLWCARLLGLRPSAVPTLTEAVRRGLIPADCGALTVAGDAAELVIPDVDVPGRHSTLFDDRLPGPLGRAVGRVFDGVMGAHPAVNAAQCTGCGACAARCPAHAIVLRDGRPGIDRRACIRCFCCQEFCPVGALYARRTWLAKRLG